MKKIFLVLTAMLLVAINYCDAKGKGKKLAIIYCDRFDNYIENYKMYKSLLGFDVTLKDVDELAAKDSANVYNWIHKNGSYSQNGWYPGSDNYILLLGKKTEVPTNHYKPSGDNKYYATDHRYILHSPSDSAGERQYNLILGRIIAYNNEQSVLKKLLEYEFKPKSYTPTNSFIESGPDPDHWEQMHATWAIVHNFWQNCDTAKFYSGTGWWSWTATDLENAWADEGIIWNYSHGTFDGIGLNGTSENEIYYSEGYFNDLPLSDDTLYPMFISNSCRADCFSHSDGASWYERYPILQRFLDEVTPAMSGPIGGLGWNSDGASYWDDELSPPSYYCLTDSSFDTWGGIFRGNLWRVGDYWKNQSEPSYSSQYFGTTGLYYFQGFAGDPTTSYRRIDPYYYEVASSSYVSVSSGSVTAYTGSDLGTVRISAYSPNTGWDSTTTIDNNGSRTFYCSDRPLFIAFTKDDASKTPTVWTTGGSLSADTWIIGKVRVNGDLTVQSGKTMEVLYGTEMIFNANSDDRASGEDSNRGELIIAGTLKADNATFKSTSKGAWYGIRFQSTATSNSYLKNCTVENARFAVCINASSPTIEESNIKSASWYGMYITGNYAWPVVDDNYIEADTFAVYLANCGNYGGNFKFNSFKTAKYGVCMTLSSPNFIDGGSGSEGHNKWESSITRHRVYVSGGYGYFGFDEDPGSNYFTRPSSSSYKYIYNSSGNTVYAANNYFDQCPDPDTDWFYGSVYRANKLGSPPSSPSAGPSWSLPKESSDFFRRLLADKKRVHEEGIASVKDELISLVEEYKTREYAALALDILLGHTSSVEMADFNQRLTNDATVPLDVKFVVDKWEAIRRYEGGDDRYDPVLKYQNTPFENEMVVINAFGLAGNGRKEEAMALVHSQIKGEDSSLIEHLVFALQRQEPYSAGGSLAKSASAPKMSVASYPNPFNGETRICFYLPDAEEVSATIYNYLGQRVKTLWRGEKEDGRHEILWDGRNDSGEMSGSGIYFCRIVAGNKSHLIKLLMIK